MRNLARYFLGAGLAVAQVMAIGLPGFAQSIQSTILGTVKDQTGASVPGVTVEVVNDGTNSTRILTTDANGDYRVTNLETGRYRVVAMLAGFTRWERDDIVLDPSQVRRIDVDLVMGMSTTVVVAADATPVATETATLSNVKRASDFTQLPLSVYGRGWVNVTNVTAAVQSAEDQLVVNGARDSANNFTSDGVSVNDIISSRQTPNGFALEVEALSEVKVQSANNSAEFPQVAQFIGVSKAGENTPHGSVYWGNFNSALSARSFFDTSEPSAVKHDMFAATLGGPVYLPNVYDGRNKTFFFFGYGGSRYRTGDRRFVSVPTAAFRRGDFSAIAHQVTIRDPETGLPFPGNRIPAERISPVSRALQDLLYPDSNRVHPGLGEFGINDNYTIDPGLEYNADVFTIRVDQKISDSNTMFVRFGNTLHNQDVVRGALKDGLDGGFVGNAPGRTVVVSDTQIFNSKVLNEFRLGYNFLQFINSDRPLGQDVMGTIGLRGVSNPKDEAILRSMPGLAFTRFAGAGGAYFTNSRQHTFQATNNLTCITGSHAIKLGADVRRYHVNDFHRPRNERGFFGFDDRLSGFDYANFLLGLPSRVDYSIPRPGAYLRSSQYAGYFQYDLTPHRKLSLSYGFRYEYQTPWVDKFDRRFGFDPGTGSLVVAGESMPNDLVPELQATLPIVTAREAGLRPRSLVEPDRNNWNARFGLAYRPFADTKTVIRGGYGLYTHMFPGLLAFRGTGGPWQTDYSLSLIDDQPTMRFPDPFRFHGNRDFGGVTNISVVDPSLPAERTVQWTVSIGREVWGTAIDVAYVGTRTSNIPFENDLNLLLPSTVPYSPARRPYPRFNTVAVLKSGGRSLFHGLTVQVDRKLAHGLAFNINYAWGRAVTDVQLRDYEAAVQQNQYHLQLERGPDPSVRQHQLRLSYVYELPSGRRLPAVARAILGGWQVSGITTMLSGRYVSPLFSGIDAANTNQFEGRPDRLGDGNITDMRGAIKAGLPMWDRSAFAVPGAGRGSYGSSGRFVLVGPGTQLWNVGLAKTFALRDRARLQLRWELFNAFNRANFGSGDPDITSGSFGLTSYADPGRSMLFGARVDF